jgi:molecular chaperone GrpE
MEDTTNDNQPVEEAELSSSDLFRGSNTPPEQTLPPEPADCAKCADARDAQLRAFADYANLKRDMERREADLTKYAVGELVKKLLPVMDSWDKAEAHRPAMQDGGGYDASAVSQWMDGLSHVRNQFATAMQKAGVTIIAETGVPYDPELHEALLRQPAPEGTPPDTVLQILDPGLKLHDRVLKPAKVAVSE